MNLSWFEKLIPNSKLPSSFNNNFLETESRRSQQFIGTGETEMTGLRKCRVVFGQLLLPSDGAMK